MAAITTCMSHCYGNTEHTLQFEDYNYMYVMETQNTLYNFKIITTCMLWKHRKHFTI